MAPDRVQPLAGIHVLVIDDDERERFFLRAALQAWGALVTAASASEAAGAVLAADVIICDLPTAEAAGPGFLAQLLRAHSRAGRRGVPMIAVLPANARGAPSGVAAQFHRFITKPVSGDELRAMVRELISDRR
jgi:CheY-like chemotaxis protein